MFRTLTGFALALFLATPAGASPFTWRVDGQITNVFPPLGIPEDGAFSVGQPFSWWITMESTAPDYDPDPSCGQYTPITSMRFTSGSLGLPISTPPGQDYLLHSKDGAGCISPPPGANFARLRSDFNTGLFFGMHFGGTFWTDALPVSTAGIGGVSFDVTYGAPPGDSFGGWGVANGTITSITNVPEPAELLLIAGGLLAAVRRMRRGARGETEARMR
jgi:hypothetical protein